jgi:ATP-binding cassette subfamily A (ABC1) protein 3
MSLWKLRKEVKDLVEEVGLAEKINTPAGSLSGGMKRKLCLAMALIGNPKFLLIDECTRYLHHHNYYYF